MPSRKKSKNAAIGSVGSMRNLGPKSVQWLGEIGINDAEDLRQAGAVGAYVRLRFVTGRKISLNLLHAMEAAIRDIDWRDLSPEDKARLKAQLPEHSTNASTTRAIRTD